MKNNGLIIALIIILSILVFGLVMLLVFCLNGNFRLLNAFGRLGTKSANIIFDETYEMDLVNNLMILSNAGDIEFKESMDKDIHIVAYGEKPEDLKVTLNNNELKVDYSEYTNNKVFSFNFYTNDIIVYIPKEYSKEININSKYGDCKILDLENATIKINQDCGDIGLGKVKDITIDSKYGDIEINEVLNKCTIESNCGDVKINKIDIKEDSSIESDFGDIKISETNDIYVDAKTDLGENKVNTNNRHSEITLKIKNDCGDIKVGD